MASSIGTAWIQIKPSLGGISNDIKKALGDSGAGASNDFSNKFKSSFLLASKQSFSQAFSEFTQRSDAAFSRFKIAAAAGFAVITAGIATFAKNLDRASGSQSAFIANMQLAGFTSEQTAKTFQTIREYADKSIYSLAEMASTAGILASTGVKNAGELVKAFGNIAAAADNPAQAIKSISMQMSQVNGKKFVQTMDFRIMQEQAAGPMKQVADELMRVNNWSLADFYDNLSAGSISAEMLNKAILTVGANPILDKLATKPRTIGDAWTALTSTIESNIAAGGSWARVQNTVIGLLVKASDWVTQNGDAIEAWISDVVNGGVALAKWVGDNKDWLLILAKLVVAYKATEVAVGAYRSAVSTLSPILKVAKGSAQLLVGGIQTLTNKFRGVSAASTGISKTTDEIDKLSSSVKRSPKKFAFGDSISSFLKNIGKTLSGAVDSIVQPLKTLSSGFVSILKTVLKGAGQAIAGFFTALASPQVLLGVVIFAAAAGSVALSILMIGSAIGAVAPGLGDFLNQVLLPLGSFLVNSLVIAIAAVTTAIIALTNKAVIPLVNAVAGGLTQAFNAVGGVITSAGDSVSKVVDSIAGGIAKVINSIANLINQTGRQDWYGTGYGITRNFSAGLVDGLIDLMQDSLNNIINNLVKVPGLGDALKAVGLKANAIDLKGFKIGKRAEGGPIFGPGSDRSDSIPLMASNGEYMIKSASARKIGYANLDQLNATGSIGGATNIYNTFYVTGDNPKENANQISRIIALQQKRVMN